MPLVAHLILSSGPLIWETVAIDAKSRDDQSRLIHLSDSANPGTLRRKRILAKNVIVCLDQLGRIGHQTLSFQSAQHCPNRSNVIQILIYVFSSCVSSFCEPLRVRFVYTKRTIECSLSHFRKLQLREDELTRHQRFSHLAPARRTDPC